MKLLFAFDFDGTLAPIVNDPLQAQMPFEVARQLKELAGLAPVYVISGRSRDDLSRRVDLPLNCLIGNHGIESFETTADDLQHSLQVVECWVKQLSHLTMQSYLKSECGVENKKYTLSLHFKCSPHQLPSVILTGLSELKPQPRVVFGHQVINLIPQGSRHKGSAFMSLLELERAQRAFYVGDDDTDEDVFALTEARLVSIRVGLKNDSNAQYFLRTQGAMVALLGLFLDLLRKSD